MTGDLDANRPILEQLEERALSDDQALESLEREVYRRPDRLLVLTNTRISSESIKD